MRGRGAVGETMLDKARRAVAKKLAMAISVDGVNTLPIEARRGKPLLDLRHDECRWPIGPDVFCGRGVKRSRVPGMPDSSYCEQHHARAYRGAAKARPLTPGEIQRRLKIAERMRKGRMATGGGR